MQKLLRNSFMAFFLACLLPALILSLISFVPSKHLNHSNEIKIYTNGDTGNIIAAIDNLKRPDVLIESNPLPLSKWPIINYFNFTGILTLCMAINWAFVNAFYTRLKRILYTEEA